MNEKITYSIIIPHKNRPDLLQRCVGSIPVRSDIQIIVVDDNSDTDKKPRIERTDVEVILLDAGNSKGAGRARNVGIGHARGQWLLFADADDYYKEGFIDVLDGYKDKSFDVVYFNYEFRDGVTGALLPPHVFQSHFTDYDGSKETKDQVRFHHNVPWTKMVSSEYVRQHHITFEETINGNDMLFSMKVGYYTENITVIKQPVYVYLKNPNSIMTTKEDAESSLCRLKQMIKQNYFYKAIGHPEWTVPVTKKALYCMYNIGLPYVVALLKNAIPMYRSRKEWVVGL